VDARLFPMVSLVSGEMLMFVARHFEFDEADFLAKFGLIGVQTRAL
jgi:hypothetical protein